RFGDLIGGPFRLPALAGDIHGLDEPVLLQVLHHGVERTPVDLDGLVLAAVTQGGGHLVRVHRPLDQQVEQRQREQVTDLPPPRLPLPGHPATPRIRVLVYEYTPGRASPATLYSERPAVPAPASQRAAPRARAHSGPHPDPASWRKRTSVTLTPCVPSAYDMNA